MKKFVLKVVCVASVFLFSACSEYQQEKEYLKHKNEFVKACLRVGIFQSDAICECMWDELKIRYGTERSGEIDFYKAGEIQNVINTARGYCEDRVQNGYTPMTQLP